MSLKESVMNEYEFRLNFRLPDDRSDPADYVDELARQGCDDALIGIGQRGRIALDFTRSAATAFDALKSAISDVKRAIPEARLIEVAPDLVGLTDLAELFGFSRQNMRKLMLSAGASFPNPVHQGKASIWHLAPVLDWIRDNRKYAVADIQVELAQAAMQVNAAREIRYIDAARREELLRLTA